MNYGQRIAAVSGAAALTLALAACGSDNEFCDSLDDFVSEYRGVEDSLLDDPDLVDSMIADLRGVAEAAPDEVSSDWNTYVDAFEVVISAAGDGDSDDEPVDAAAAMTDLQQASGPINEHATQECDVQIS